MRKASLRTTGLCNISRPPGFDQKGCMRMLGIRQVPLGFPEPDLGGQVLASGPSVQWQVIEMLVVRRDALLCQDLPPADA